MSDFWSQITQTDAVFATDPAFMPGAELITYTPAEGDPVTFSAQVFRDVPVDTELGVSLKFRIVVSRKFVPVVDTSIDSVRIAKKFGGCPEDLSVSEIVNSDAGAFELQLE